MLSRFRLHGLPVRSSERTVTPTPERATALLQAALNTIRSDATTLLQVTRDQTAPGQDPAQGLQIPTPRDADRKALLMEAGLESGTRLVEINGEPVPDLEGLAGMIEAAMEPLNGGIKFSIHMKILLGNFETMSLMVQSPE